MELPKAELHVHIEGTLEMDNYVGTARALGLSRDEMFRVARNSFSASFLPDADKQRHLQAVDDYAARIGTS